MEDVGGHWRESGAAEVVRASTSRVADLPSRQEACSKAAMYRNRRVQLTSMNWEKSEV